MVTSSHRTRLSPRRVLRGLIIGLLYVGLATVWLYFIALLWVLMIRWAAQ